MKNSTVVQIALIPSSQDQDSDLLDQIFGFEPESHASVSCPHCGSLVSYFSDLEFHNCSGGLLIMSKNIAQKNNQSM